MKKSHLIFTIMLFMVVGYAAMQVRMNVKGSTNLSENLDDFNVYIANLKLNNTEIEGINETKDGYVISIPSKGTLEYDIVNDSTEYDVEASVECEETNEQNTWTFDYTGDEQTFTVPKDGTYKLETWGAQGGDDTSTYIGGYGGYSTGQINIKKNVNLYINVGESGKTNSSRNDKSLIAGGYNGGGGSRRSRDTSGKVSSGGGATHIANVSGLLSTLENKKSDILMVSGGGGGSSDHGSSWHGKGGHSGGYIGVSAYDCYDAYKGSKGYVYGVGGTQFESYNKLDAAVNTNGSFGKGAEVITTGMIGGGGGFYGGTSGLLQGGGGGSSYIGNTLLTNKAMYCYNCEESSEESTKTISTTCVNEEPTENCAKKGNGYARITSSSQVQPIQLAATTIEAQDRLSNKVEVDNNGMKCNLKIKKISRTEKKVYTGPTEWTFDYTGSEQTFTVPTSGTYKLETWGASGGGNYTINSKSCLGGYGGYSIGTAELNVNDKLYVNVGGQGKNGTNINASYKGGYNGGGNSGYNGVGSSYGGSGGGATHIATTPGLLSTLENKKDSILIVSGAGGASGINTSVDCSSGGHAGGIVGGDASVYTEYLTTKTDKFNSLGATQTQGGSCYYNDSTYNQYCHQGTFGQGGSPIYGGGGGGFYGGGGFTYSGGGGSGYIGNSSLSNKSMYCYNCEESSEESTKTISTTCVNETPTENCAKKGNGYARITLIK